MSIQIVNFNNVIELRDLIYKCPSNQLQLSREYIAALNNNKEYDNEIIKAIKNIEEIYSISFYYESKYKQEITAGIHDNNFTAHNLLNNTHGKRNVAAIHLSYNNRLKSIYCPCCKKVHLVDKTNMAGTLEIINDTNQNEFENLSTSNYRFMLNTYKFIVNVQKITCNECGSIYNTSDLKFVSGSMSEEIAGEIFYDEDKITLSLKYSLAYSKSDNRFYYDQGYKRVTLNTKTGYSFTTCSGHAYRELNKLWARYNKKAPKMHNSTYTFEDNTGNILLSIAKVKRNNYLKSLDEKEREKQINECMTEEYLDNIYYSLQKELHSNLHKMIQKNYSYKIKTLQEYEDEYNKTANMHNYYCDDTRLIKRYNRYINLNPYGASVNCLLDREYNYAKNKVSREEINIINALFKDKKVTLGKKARALTQREVDNLALLRSVSFLISFKNPDIINRLLNIFSSNNETARMISSYYTCSDLSSVMDLWINLRGEKYVAKELINAVKNNTLFDKHSRILGGSKLYYMRDTSMMLANIKNNIKDFKIEDVAAFKNEKQIHDDISRYYNSEEYHLLSQKKQYEIVFELEKDAFDLQDEEKNILIAKNRGVLSHIGRQMNICVGGYSRFVESGHCRIVYITNAQGEYQACLELVPHKINDKTKYELVQAKLKYNRLPYNNMEIYDKIVEWTKDKDIKIKTSDMDIPNYKKTNQVINLNDIIELEEEQEREIDDIDEMEIPF